MYVVGRAEIERFYTMDDAFAAVRDAAIAWTTGGSTVPQRTALYASTSELETLVMPGVVGEEYSGAKIWYSGPGSAALPATSALIVLLDPELGEVVLDGSVITDLRTGAMTGLVAQHLAPVGASVATIIGAGIQARTQALALAHGVPTLREIRINSRRAEARERFVAELAAELSDVHPEVNVTSHANAEASCIDSHIVVAATTARAPVVKNDWVADGALVCSVGSHDPGAAEIDPEIVRRASMVVVDTKRGAIDGAADIAQVIDDGGLRRDQVLELGELLTAPEVATQNAETSAPKVLKTVGFATADLVSARRVARAAIASGAAHPVQIH